MRTLRLDLCLAASLGLALAAGCGSKPGTISKDAGDSGADAPLIPTLTCNAQKSDCMDFVFDSLSIPTADNVNQLALDLNGDGKVDNTLGAVLAVFSAGENNTLQNGLDKNLFSGKNIMLLRLGAADFVNAQSATAQTWLGAPTPCCSSTSDLAACKAEAAATCFNGTKEFAPDTTSPARAVFPGRISGGTFEVGPGAMTLQLQFGMAGVVLSINLTGCRLRGTLSGDKISQGILAGGLTRREADALLPEIATIMTVYLNDPNASATMKSFLGAFDKNSDLKVEVSELVQDSVINPILSGDIDTDKDGKNDLLSLGIGFTAVGAVIKK